MHFLKDRIADYRDRFRFHIDHLKHMEVNLNPQTEEMRGIFVLGVIGSLLAVLTTTKVLEHTNLAPNVPLSLVAIFLIMFWGSYTFLMVVGISDDLINPAISHFCHLCAEAFFILGVSITFALIPTGLLARFVVKPLGLPEDASAILLFLITAYLFVKLARKPSKDLL